MKNALSFLELCENFIFIWDTVKISAPALVGKKVAPYCSKALNFIKNYTRKCVPVPF